jgi:hypothetical protein
VLNVFDPIRDLYDPVGYAVSVFGKIRHRQRNRIDVLVYGGSEHGAWMMMKIRRVIGSTPEETDPERGSGNIDH